jgi:hypothetical protein
MGHTWLSLVGLDGGDGVRAGEDVRKGGRKICEGLPGRDTAIRRGGEGERLSACRRERVAELAAA